jgi:hypothetical protein
MKPALQFYVVSAAVAMMVTVSGAWANTAGRILARGGRGCGSGDGQKGLHEDPALDGTLDEVQKES